MDNNEDTKNILAEGLNKNHIRTISVTLSSIEEDLDQLEQYIRCTSKGSMYEIINDLNEEQKEQVLMNIRSVKECIKEFAYAFNLKPQTKKLSNIIKGDLTVDWSDACELEPQRIKSYGALGKDALEVLELHSQKLIALLRNFF